MEHFFEQLLIVFNAVAPFFLIMGLGWFLCRIGLVGDPFFKGVNKMAFTCFFPALLFMNMYQADLATAFDLGLVVYFVVGILTIYILLWVVTARSGLLDKPRTAVFVQAGYRSNYLVLAVPIIGLLMGPEALPKTTLILPFLVALYNILAATLFVVAGLDTTVTGVQRLRRVLIGILKTPMIIAVIIGMVANLIDLRLPVVLDRSLASVAAVAPPAALLSIGGALTAACVRRNLRFAVTAATVKNVITPILFIVPAILLGFRGVELAIIALIGLTPVGTQTYTTAVEMGGDSDSAASCLILSNAAAMFTIVPGLTLLWVLGLF